MLFHGRVYLTKPVAKADLLAAIAARFERERLNEARLRDQLARLKFEPDFSSSKPLTEKLALSDREAEVLLWVAQGKSNADVGAILEMSEKTVKKHLGSVFEKLGVESRTAATSALSRRWDCANLPESERERETRNSRQGVTALSAED